MRLTLVGLLVLATLPAVAGAQPAPTPRQAPLEIRQRESPPEAKPGHPVVPPAAQSEAASEAEHGVAELERAERGREALREHTAPSAPPRPDLGYDVRSGIQERNLRRALPR